VTINELYKLLSDKADAEPEVGDVPDNLPKLLRQIAEWIHISQPGFARSDLDHMRTECRVLTGTLVEVHRALGVLMEDAEDADPDTLLGYIPDDDEDELRENMTDEYRKYLDLLIDLNGRAALVIQDGRRDPLEPFYIVHEVGWHAPTRQLVFRRGVRIDENNGEDYQFREQVQWAEPEYGSDPA
jgi:hypothetical protein